MRQLYLSLRRYYDRISGHELKAFMASDVIKSANIDKLIANIDKLIANGGRYDVVT